MIKSLTRILNAIKGITIRGCVKLRPHTDYYVRALMPGRTHRTQRQRIRNNNCENNNNQELMFADCVSVAFGSI